MDGDEGRSGATAVCEGTGDEAEASGDVAPAPVTGRPEHEDDADASTAGGLVEALGEDSVADDPDPDGAAADDSGADDSVADDAVADDADPGDAPADAPAPDGAVADEQESAEDAPTDDEDVSETASATDAATATPVRRSFVRRGVLALAVAGFVALAVGVFAWVAPSAEAADQRFVDSAQSHGHLVVPGEQQSLVVSAARKICDRRVLNNTEKERRATALTTSEIAAVGTAFGADTRDFTTLALDTYCSS